jgi:hypothetical protein
MLRAHKLFRPLKFHNQYLDTPDNLHLLNYFSCSKGQQSTPLSQQLSSPSLPFFSALDYSVAMSLQMLLSALAGFPV